jgi:hypothetical protein
MPMTPVLRLRSCTFVLIAALGAALFAPNASAAAAESVRAQAVEAGFSPERLARVESAMND